MIDPSNITNYHLDKYQLQEMLIFWVLVAGKTAKTTVKYLQLLLDKLHIQYEMNEFHPFDVIRMYDEDNPGGGLEKLLKDSGFGCQKTKAKGLRQLIRSGMNLRTCSVEDLEKIYGIGPKTARCFVMHTRENARHAGIDTHLLKWLKSLGIKVPKSTPTGRTYAHLECVFLVLADRLSMTPAALDLAVWNAYSSGNEYKVDIEIPKGVS
jgi:endonuclease III